MATYTFKAIDLAGTASVGEVDAATKQAVSDQLKSRGLIVVDVKSKTASKEFELPWNNRVKAQELTVAVRQLATMISSGMTLLRALTVLETQSENKKLKATLSDVRRDVEAGLQFSDAVERHPKVFDQLFVAMVRAGETGGVLEDSLLRVADQMEKDDSLRRQVKSAMMYPSVIISFALVVLLVLIAFLVPVFAGIFDDLGGKLPAITQLTVTASNILKGYWYAIFGGVIALVIGIRKWKASKTGRMQWDTMRLKIPFKIGEVQQKIALARWSRTLAALMGAGVPILQAIEITGKTAGNSVVEKSMGEVIESVKSGGTLAGPLKNAPVFPGMVAHMIAVGEETGALDTMLNKVADFYEDEVAAAVKALTSILEPVMIIVVGGIVGFIVVAMYMPMFKIYDEIK